MMSFTVAPHRVLVRTLAVTALAAGFASVAHAQSQQTMLGKLGQLQESLNLFAASTASSFSSVLSKLDEVLTRLSPNQTGPVLLTTAAGIVTIGSEAVCSVVLVGLAPASGTGEPVQVQVRFRDASGGTLGGASAPLRLGQASGFLAAGSGGSIYCEFEAPAGSTLRAAMTIYNGTRNAPAAMASYEAR